MIVLELVAIAGLAILLAGRLRRLLHLLQLEHYENARLAGWLRRTPAFLRPLPVTAVVAAAIAGALLHGVVGAVLLAVAAALAAAVGVLDWRAPEKKPLVFTSRARRLVVAASIVAVVAVAVAAVFGGAVVAAAIVVALAPLLLAAANVALRPVERRINAGFVTRARRKLADVHPLVVGITGSYGKTTTKFCSGEVLAQRGPTLVTPESYNSFLGVVRTINERLEPAHESFVVEMGAYRRGDIAELSELVSPRIGVITAIGPMHLERFGTLDAIAETKGELARALPPDGVLVTNGDDERCRAIAATTPAARTIFFALARADADVRATEIRLAAGRTEFTLHLEGRTHAVTAALLGDHNVANLLAAAAVGLAVGLDDEAIVRGLERCTAPAHRLAPIVNRGTGVTVIDDAYNSNPAGAAAALQVLAAHEAERRLLVTPGMVELGDVEETENRRFGEAAAGVCDLAILVGPARTRPVAEGLRAGGLADDRVLVVQDIEEATKRLGEVIRRGDVVLFENDLPDLYAEAPTVWFNAARR